MTPLADRFWQLLLAQGICTGIGSGQLFIVSVALLPQWFTTKRSTATGIAATGSSAAAIIYPPMFHYLVDSIGFGWTVRSIAFVALAVCLVSLSVARMRTQPPPRPKIVDFTGFKEPEYALFALVPFFGGIGRHHMSQKLQTWESIADTTSPCTQACSYHSSTSPNTVERMLVASARSFPFGCYLS